MALNSGPTAVGNHLYFARDGDLHGAAVTIARESKPVKDDSAWIDIGIISEPVVIGMEGQERKIFAPTPGRLRLWDVIRTQDEMTIKFTAEELTSLGAEILFGAVRVQGAALAQYNPMESGVKKGWAKIQQYSQQDDTLLNTLDVFCYIKCGEVPFGPDMKFSFELRVLHSTLNTGTF